MSALFQQASMTNNTFARGEALRESVWNTTNPTMGTGIAYANDTTSFSAILGLMNVYNNDTTNKKVWIRPVKLSLRHTTINTSGTSLHFRASIDDGDKHTSGGTDLSAQNVQTGWGNPTYVDGWAARTSHAVVDFGALVIAAATANIRYVWYQQVMDVIAAADDVLIIEWGGVGFEGQQNRTWKWNAPPMWIGPGASMTIHYWAPSASADTDPEVNFTWIEHPYGGA